MLKFSFLLLMLVSGLGLADAPLNIVRVNGDKSLSAAESAMMFSSVNTLYSRELHISFHVRAEYDYYDNASYGLEIENYYHFVAFFYWLSRLRADNILDNKNVLTFAVLPPLYDSANIYAGGTALYRSIGIAEPFAVVFCGGHYQSGCKIGVAHEIGHVFGMAHLRIIKNNSFLPNIMDNGAYQFGEAGFTMLHRSKVQAKRHLKAVNLWKRFRR